MNLGETTSFTSGGEPNILSPTHRIPRPLPVVHELHPQYYDGYQGPNHIPACVTHMPISYKRDRDDEKATVHKAVIRLADMWIDPFYDLRPRKYINTETSRRSIFHNAVPTNLEPNSDLTPATIIYIGGGDSDALASTGIVGYIRDAQRESLEKSPNARWYARNVVTVSHPMGAPRTQGDVAATSMKLSAEIVRAAIMQAIADNSISAKNIILMGSSAGGALATELAALLGDQCKQLILEEPAAMGNHNRYKTMILNFGLSGLRGAYLDKRRHGMNRREAIRFALDDTRLSWTRPEGAPENWKELWKSLRPHQSNYASLGAIFGLKSSVTSHGLSTKALGNDTTAEARDKIKCPVTLVGSTNSKVVNLFHDRAGFTHHKLSQVSAENEPPNVRRVATSMMKRLFPYASTRLVAMVPGYAHSGLGRNQGVWQQLLTEVQQISLAA